MKERFSHASSAAGTSKKHSPVRAAQRCVTVSVSPQGMTLMVRYAGLGHTPGRRLPRDALGPRWSERP